MALPPAALPSGMQPPPAPVSSMSASAVHRPPGTGTGTGPGPGPGPPGPGHGHGHGPPSAHGHHPHPHQHQHTHGHGHGHGPQTPVTPSLTVAGLQYGPDPALATYQVHHGHGMAAQPQPQHSGYSSPWGDPPHAHALVGPPPARPASSASAGAGVGGMSVGLTLNGAPGGSSQPQQRYGGELREDAWGGGGGGGEGDLEVSLSVLPLTLAFVWFCARSMPFLNWRKFVFLDSERTGQVIDMPYCLLASCRTTELPICSLRCVLTP